MLTEGPDVTTSFFETPIGKAGLLICADIQCIVANMTPSTSCSAHAVDLLNVFFSEETPAIVFFTTYWTVGSGIWGAVNVQKKAASYGHVWWVSANTTASPGNGGGIITPDGEELDIVISSTPTNVYGDIPFLP